MKTPLLRAACLLLVLLLPAFAMGKTQVKDELREKILSELPEKVRAIHPGVTPRAEIAKLFGEPLPDSTSREAYFSTRSEPSSDLTVGFEGDKVRYFAFDIPDSARAKLTLPELRKLIPDSSVAAARKEWEKNSASHEAGREFSVRVPKDGLLLRFVETEKAPLKAVLVWKAGAKAP